MLTEYADLTGDMEAVVTLDEECTIKETTTEKGEDALCQQQTLSVQTESNPLFKIA